MFLKDDKMNVYIVSIIWGLGLATLFRKVCNKNKCIVIKAPKNINNYQQNIDNSCYNFEKVEVDCN